MTRLWTKPFMNAQDVFLNGSVMNHARLLSGYRDALAMLTRETALVGRGRAASATRCQRYAQRLGRRQGTRVMRVVGGWCDVGATQGAERP